MIWKVPENIRFKYNLIYNFIILKMVLTRIRTSGGSFIVTLPKKIVEKEGLKEDELVDINIKKARVSGFGISRGIGSFTKEYEFDIE